MSISSRHLVEKGIELCKSDQKAQARKILEAVLYSDRQNETAWVWYIAAQETREEKISALERFLSVFPDHPAGRMALADLKSAESSVSKAQESPPKKDKMVERTAAPTPVSEKKLASPQNTLVRGIPWYLIILGLCILLCSGGIVISRYNSLRAENENLAANNRLISTTLDQSKKDNETLQLQNNQLINEYNSLAGQYNRLKNEHSILLGNYDALFTEHNQLIEKYNGLAGDYNVLDSIAIKPPYIFIHDRIVETTFYDTDEQLIKWSTPFSALEYAIEKGDFTRQKMMDQGWYTTEVYTKEGKRLGIRDFSIFVTPQPFDQVMPDIYNSSASAYEFVFRTWNIIGQLSNYASEETETPRYPYETLLAGGGDCEDLSILFASLIKAAPVNWYVDLVYVDSDNFLNPSKHNHVLVYIDTGNETFLVETTRDDVMLPYENGVVGWLAADLDSLDQDEYYPVYLR